MEYIKCSEENPLPPKFITIKGMDGYETYKIDDNTMGVRPIWISVKDRLPNDRDCVLASDGEQVGEYYFMKDHFETDEGYSINATHWMPMPNPPEE